MGAIRKLLLATFNDGKLRELRGILSGIPYELVSLAELGITSEVEETGSTFAENAALKAREYARLSGLLTLADDSGLEVDALGRAPGVKSARYAGPGASDEDRYALLLRNLQGVPEEKRTARFRCVVAIATPEGEVRLAEGTVEGMIAEQPRGSHGFGYDPVFYIPELGVTMAELPPEKKNDISHRARAVRAARAILLAWNTPEGE